MSINAVITERNRRLYSLVQNREWTKDMIVAIRLDPKLISDLRTAAKIFIYDCLSEYFADQHFDIDMPIEDFVRKYDEQIISLPNITPNGLMLPKKEVLLSYNLLLKSVGNMVKDLGIDATCRSIACPVNLRVNFGSRMKEASMKRPKSSTIWHTDIWAGQNARDVMLHTPIFGNFVENGILFATPPEGFYPDFIKTLPSFNDGSEVTAKIGDSAYNPEMKIGYTYLVDSFLLHKTLSRDDSLRGIISFPMQPKESVSSDIYHNPARDEEYFAVDEWLKYGMEKLVYTDKKLEPFTEEDVSRNSYADKFQSIDLK